MDDVKAEKGTKKLLLRPHHGLCIQHFQGKGYSAEFTGNMTRTIAVLEGNPTKEITLHSGTDILCGHCPHNEGGKCESSQKVDGYDAAVLAFCGLKDGDTLPWQKFRGFVRSCIMETGQMAQVCGDCEWLPLCKVASREK